MKAATAPRVLADEGKPVKIKPEPPHDAYWAEPGANGRKITVEVLLDDPAAVLVCSVWPGAISRDGQLGTKHLNPLPRNENGPDWNNGFTSTWVNCGARDLDLKDGERLRQYRWHAREVATDYFGRYFDRGVFIAAGDYPTEEELAAARAKRTAYFRQAISEGRREFDARRNVLDVPSDARWAAEALGVAMPWSPDFQGTTMCPFCAEEIKPTAIVCKHCHRDLVVPKEAVEAAPVVPTAGTPADWNEPTTSGGTGGKSKKG